MLYRTAIGGLGRRSLGQAITPLWGTWDRVVGVDGRGIWMRGGGGLSDDLEVQKVSTVLNGAIKHDIPCFHFDR